MLSLLRHSITQFFKAKEISSLVSSNLQQYDALGKQQALDAVNILIRYKTTVHEFTDEIIDFWPLPRRVMERYRFDNVAQLNEWLDNLS